MSVTLLTALSLEALAVSLLRLCLGRCWLRHPGTLIVLASAVYQGLSPVLMSFQSTDSQDYYGLGVPSGFTGLAALLMSAGMLAFTVAYVMTRPGRPGAAPADIRGIAIALDWRWLAAACVPLAVLTYEGRGFNDGVGLAGSATPIGSDLAATFFVPLVAVTAFSFLLRHGTRWFIPVLIAQSLMLAAAGERTPVIMDAIALIVMLCVAGKRPSARHLRGASALTVVAVLAITGLRAEQGRSLFYQDSGLSTRVAALGGGLTQFTGSAPAIAAPDLIAQAAARLDGTEFAGAVLQSLSYGQPRLGPTDIPESLLLAVPSWVWSSKLAHGSALNPGKLEVDDFGLQRVVFLPTLPGLYIGFLSAPWLIIFLAFIGLLCGWGERWLFRRCTPARLVILAGAVTAALEYEAGLPTMLVHFRVAVPFAAAVKVAELVRGRRRVAGRAVESFAP